jgi:cupin 2 domain-containing protein
MSTKNIFNDIPSDLPEEVTEKIISSGKFRIERIISKGHSSSKDFWYNQEENEWVIVLKGKARLEFSGENELIELSEGDYINIPTHKKHRIEWTDPENETIWLAVFY